MTVGKAYWNEKRETLSRDEYMRIQENALLRELSYVWKNSQFYQKKFRDEGIGENDIKGLGDLKSLPFTEKDEIRESLDSAPPLGKHAAVDISEAIRIYSTSGTTGNPTYIGLTSRDREVWRETAMRAMWTCGMRPSHIVPLTVGTFFIAASYGEAIEKLGATLVPVGIGATDRLIGALKNLGANFILSTTSFPLYLINYCERNDIDPKTLGIEGFQVGGEPGGGIPNIRQKIENSFSANVQECMGNGDMLGLMWAECEYKKGMHFIGQ
jgi:phenylacetate-CoA ligase